MDFGLTKNEALVYNALLKFGPSLAGQISRKSGLHRRTVYDVTDRLIEKGLVGYILENNRRKFEASNPKKFYDALDEKRKLIDMALPTLMGQYEKNKDKQETNFYKGRNGLKTVFEDQIETGKEILVMGANEDAYEILQYYFKWFDKKRKEKKIRTKIIFNKVKKKVNVPLSEIRYLPEKYGSVLAINIYGDKVAIILWSCENPIAIVINHPEVSEGYRKHFEMMWKMSRK